MLVTIKTRKNFRKEISPKIKLKRLHNTEHLSNGKSLIWELLGKNCIRKFHFTWIYSIILILLICKLFLNFILSPQMLFKCLIWYNWVEIIIIDSCKLISTCTQESVALIQKIVILNMHHMMRIKQDWKHLI